MSALLNQRQINRNAALGSFQTEFWRSVNERGSGSDSKTKASKGSFSLQRKQTRTSPELSAHPSSKVLHTHTDLKLGFCVCACACVHTCWCVCVCVGYNEPYFFGFTIVIGSHVKFKDTQLRCCNDTRGLTLFRWNELINISDWLSL